MKIGNKAIWKYIHGGEWKEREVIIEHISEDYITVRIPGTLGGTLHLVCPGCLRVI